MRDLSPVNPIMDKILFMNHKRIAQESKHEHRFEKLEKDSTKRFCKQCKAIIT